MKTLHLTIVALTALVFVACNCSTKSEGAGASARWTKQQAAEWYAQQPWLAGSDYIPANAINQLEMWQAETFDAATIEKEFELAKSIGFNTMRVYLHSLAYELDPDGFKGRMNTFLEIAECNGIRPLFVIFDDCWRPEFAARVQPEPIPFRHNSGWVQDPGSEAHKNWDAVMPKLEIYVKDILTTFKDDQRILMWDLYNEPGNNGYRNESMPLVEKVFEWAQTVRPSQPLTIGIWDLSQPEMNEFFAENSDIISYHNYSGYDHHKMMIQMLQIWGRPLVCTEYMARGNSSTFKDIMPLLKEYNVGAINWGFVDGKTQTKYPWDSAEKDYSGGLPIWFHDIFNGDYTPYNQEEVDLIMELTAR